LRGIEFEEVDLLYPNVTVAPRPVIAMQGRLVLALWLHPCRVMPCNKAAFEAYVCCDALANVNAIEWGSIGSHVMEMENRHAIAPRYNLEDCQRPRLPHSPLKNLKPLRQRQLLSTSSTASRTGTEHSRLALTQSTLHQWYHYGPPYYRKAHRCTQSISEWVNKPGDKRNVSS
jgi:hypothetical protein